MVKDEKEAEMKKFYRDLLLEQKRAALKTE